MSRRDLARTEPPPREEPREQHPTERPGADSGRQPETGRGMSPEAMRQRVKGLDGWIAKFDERLEQAAGNQMMIGALKEHRQRMVDEQRMLQEKLSAFEMPADEDPETAHGRDLDEKELVRLIDVTQRKLDTAIDEGDIKTLYLNLKSLKSTLKRRQADAALAAENDADAQKRFKKVLGKPLAKKKAQEEVAPPSSSTMPGATAESLRESEELTKFLRGTRQQERGDWELDTALAAADVAHMDQLEEQMLQQYDEWVDLADSTNPLKDHLREAIRANLEQLKEQYEKLLQEYAGE